MILFISFLPIFLAIKNANVDIFILNPSVIPLLLTKLQLVQLVVASSYSTS
jgi:hypothetical protein